MDMKALYQRRSAEFVQDIRPYLFYAIQSVGMFSAIAIVLFSIGYRTFLLWVTPEFPWQPLGAAAMALALATGRVRTFLKEADTLFLLPQERGMSHYLQQAMRRAVLLQTAAAIAAWLLVWPLYGRMTQADGIVFAALLVVWAVLKRVLLHGKWTELQFQEQSARRWFALLRWLVAASAAYALIAFQLPYGVMAASAAALLYIVLLRLPAKYTVHWTMLIDMEKRHKATVYRLLNWFIDVPQVQGKARSVPMPAWLRSLIPFRRRSSYTYLYTLVWLRSELFGITLRLTSVGIVIIASIANDWAALIVYAAFGLFGALQLSDLKRYYRVHIWRRIYPLPDKLPGQSAGAVRFCIHLAMLLLMAIPLYFAVTKPIWTVGLFLAGAAVSWLYHKLR